MFDLFPQIIIIISISGIILLIARKIPLLASIPQEEKISDINGIKFIKTPGFLKKLVFKIKGFRYSEYSHRIIDISEKTLRRLKVIFLKLENKITEWAEFLKQQSHKIRKRREGVGVEIKSGNSGSKILNFSGKYEEKNAFGIETDSAEEKYIAEITKNPRDIETYRMLGDLYIKKNNISDAREAFRQILRLNPSDKDAGIKLMKLRVRKKV